MSDFGEVEVSSPCGRGLWRVEMGGMNLTMSLTERDRLAVIRAVAAKGLTQASGR